ncbi:RTA1 domain-containing protein [Aspergillus homomorphus CBS 101889]|uniref:RTA1 domain protein n=1 Tax=Aspergillus homomorphus (strain CBS 101889) TaxID=1450537 RepID=A0A395I2K2_ASPHC|nr:hypothetical protein BO97DRAFT_442187 [Aspergillus homomorphus CBS 101889]RAL13893.1 hypothetical protein BO97DRAFT_442187 [Aspergillus homomorphus CBS 101889]
MTQCKALTTPDTMWNFCPSSGAAYLFTVLFALTTLAHISQAILYRKFYCWVIAMSGTIQTVTYIFRVLSIANPASYEDYAAWFVLILIAPLWTNAFVYMVMGRMVWNFTDDARVLRVRPWHFGFFFVVLDIMHGFQLFVYGAAQAAGNNVSYDTEMTGLHIYMAGVGVQQLFVLMFVVCAVAFHRKILLQERPDAKKALLLLYVLYACLALITMRIIFRLCEYAQGLKSTIPSHEAYQYCLDSVPMLLALVLLNAVHPGRLMPGPNSDLPSRKQRKKMGLDTKAKAIGNDMMLQERDDV